MTGEAREPTLATGMDLLKIMERIKEETGPAVGLHVDMALDFLDKLLDEARAEERARISFQLGLVAGEGYKGWRELEASVEALLGEWSGNTKGGLFDELAGILHASKQSTGNHADVSREPETTRRVGGL